MIRYKTVSYRKDPHEDHSLGVTGGSGQAFVALALEAGHEVTAIARRPEAVGIESERLQIVQASVVDADALEPHILGSDVVVSALGVSGLFQARKGTTIYSESSAAIMEASMRESGLDYTIVHPPFLVGDKQRTDYRIAIDDEVPDDKTLSRWSLGHVPLAIAETDQYNGRMVSVSL